MDMNRYSVIPDKRPREIVLLQGRGCFWRRCAFCDYYHDAQPDDDAAFALNSRVLSQVTGQYGELSVINSGSVFEFDPRTLDLIHTVCLDRGISTLRFESHWRFRDRIPQLRRDFAPITLKMKVGIETFDFDLRENVWHKGIPERDPRRIAEGFDEANLLVGVVGQTRASMERDVDLALSLFERFSVNVMCANTTPVQPDPQVIDEFMAHVYPRIVDDPRVDVLIENTDFGVGA